MDDAPADNKKSTGPLWDRLKSNWASGKMSAAEVQGMAMDALKQGAQGMGDMASLGASGTHPQNCYRALKNALGLPPGAPNFYWARIPTIHGDRTWHPFLLPHEFFASFLNAEPAKWTAAIGGRSGAALEFWQSMRGSDFVRLHPNLPKSSWSRTVPLGMHGDGASFSKQDSVYTFSWNSLIGTGGTMAKRFVATVMKKTDMVDDSMDVIARIMSWSFNVLLSGTTPSMDWEGQPLGGGGEELAGGWRGSICQLRGDWAVYCELFKFPQWNSAERMCWLCKASSTNPAMAWVRFGPGAGWRKTKWTHEAYLAFLRAAGLAIPALLAIAIGFRLDCVMIDVLHTVDQGVASHIIANVMWHFAVVRRAFGGTNQEQCVNNLYSHLQRWNKQVKPATTI